MCVCVSLNRVRSLLLLRFVEFSVYPERDEIQHPGILADSLKHRVSRAKRMPKENRASIRKWQVRTMQIGEKEERRKQRVNGWTASFNDRASSERYLLGNHMVEQGETVLKMTLINFGKRPRWNLYSAYSEGRAYRRRFTLSRAVLRTVRELTYITSGIKRPRGSSLPRSKDTFRPRSSVNVVAG